mmetsp:Transcript_16323/g.23306  ORF Transcript_16323/g.23306 Transcript_16323/m.23306 type:complete len:221 (-) Transcript_16323:45-707(-)
MPPRRKRKSDANAATPSSKSSKEVPRDGTTPTSPRSVESDHTSSNPNEILDNNGADGAAVSLFTINVTNDVTLTEENGGSAKNSGSVGTKEHAAGVIISQENLEPEQNAVGADSSGTQVDPTDAGGDPKSSSCALLGTGIDFSNGSGPEIFVEGVIFSGDNAISIEVEDNDGYIHGYAENPGISGCDISIVKRNCVTSFLAITPFMHEEKITKYAAPRVN